MTGDPNKQAREHWQSRVNANRERLEQRREELRREREERLAPKREELRLDREKRIEPKQGGAETRSRKATWGKARRTRIEREAKRNTSRAKNRLGPKHDEIKQDRENRIEPKREQLKENLRNGTTCGREYVNGTLCVRPVACKQTYRAEELGAAEPARRWALSQRTPALGKLLGLCRQGQNRRIASTHYSIGSCISPGHLLE